MSDIYGQGFGDSHDWKRGYTPQVGSWGTKSTGYKCTECGAEFTHYYDYTPDIFTALESSGVPDRCAKVPTEHKTPQGDS